MKRLMVMMLVAAPLAAQETSLTVYQDGSVLVRRAVNQPIARGASTFGFDLVNPTVEPGSFVIGDEGIELRAARLPEPGGLNAALRRAVGRDIEFQVVRGDSTRWVRGRVLAAMPFSARIDGRVVFTMPGTPAFPDSLALVTPRVDLTVMASRANTGARVAYLTGGLRWGAQINVIVPRVGGGPATVNGVAVLTNQGITVRGADVQLASGEIRRARMGLLPSTDEVRLEAINVMRARSSQVLAAEAPVEEGVGETRVYALPARLDLEPGTTTTTVLFPQSQTEVERLLVINASGDLISQWTERADSNMHPQVSYRVRRAEGTPFGALAMPAAVWRLVAPDTAGRLQLLGEGREGATPAGRDVEIATGTASDVIVDRIQTAFERRGERETIATFRVTIRNSKDESATVFVNEEAPGRWEVLNSTVPAERLASGRFRFAVPVPARSTAVLEYRVRVRL